MNPSLDASALSEFQDSPELRHGTFTERTERGCGCIVANPEKLGLRPGMLRGVATWRLVGTTRNLESKLL